MPALWTQRSPLSALTTTPSAALTPPSAHYPAQCSRILPVLTTMPTTHVHSQSSCSGSQCSFTHTSLLPPRTHA
eukprot:2832131-Rhodomonas_salina.1